MSDDELNFLLRNLMNDIDGLKSAALVSREGLIVSAVMEEGVSQMKIAALSAVILSMAERVLMELDQGELDTAIIQGSSGASFLVMGCGMEYIVVAVLDEDARMDKAFVAMQLAGERIVDVLD